MKIFNDEFLNEKVKLPDVGETVAFEDEIKTKLLKTIDDTKGKSIKISPNEELEVIENENFLVLKYKKGFIRLESQEYKIFGGFLV